MKHLFAISDEAVAAALAQKPRRVRRLFARGVTDAVLARTPAVLTFLVGIPAVVWASVHAPLSELAFVAGWLAWTFIEYVLHRFGLHLPEHTPSFRVASFVVHGHHHAEPVPQRLVAPLLQAALLQLLVLGAWRLAWPERQWSAWAGTLTGYLVYEAIHYQIHFSRWRVIALLRRYHLRHHGQPHARFGISSPLWDFVFRTQR